MIFAKDKSDRAAFTLTPISTQNVHKTQPKPGWPDPFRLHLPSAVWVPVTLVAFFLCDLFIWLRQVLAAASGVSDLRCGTQDL